MVLDRDFPRPPARCLPRTVRASACNHRPGPVSAFRSPRYNGQYPQSIATAPNASLRQSAIRPAIRASVRRESRHAAGVDLRLQAAQQQLTAGTNAIRAGRAALAAERVLRAVADRRSSTASVSRGHRCALERFCAGARSRRRRSPGLGAGNRPRSGNLYRGGGHHARRHDPDRRRTVAPSRSHLHRGHLNPDRSADRARRARREATIAARRATFSASACSPWT